MSHFKNTPITGLSELVIDGRTKKIQWKKYNKEWWWRNDFEQKPVFPPHIDTAINNYPEISEYYEPNDDTITIKHIKVLPHSEIMRRMHNYDDHPEKFDTWISGFTFNCKVIKKEKKRDKSKELLELLHSYMRGEIDDWSIPPDPENAMEYLLEYRRKYGLHHD